MVVGLFGLIFFKLGELIISEIKILMRIALVNLEKINNLNFLKKMKKINLKTIFANAWTSMEWVACDTYATISLIVETVAITLIILGTIAIAIAALVGFFTSLVWMIEACEGIPAVFHSATKFVAAIGDLPGATWLPWESIPTAFWAYPLKLQGLIMAFLGATSFVVASYTSEWLNAVMKVICPTPKAIWNSKKLQMVSNLVDQWWNVLITATRKLAVWITLGIGGTALFYLTWHALQGTFRLNPCSNG